SASVPIVLFVARQNISLTSRLALGDLLRKVLPPWIIKRWHCFSHAPFRSLQKLRRSAFARFFHLGLPPDYVTESHAARALNGFSSVLTILSTRHVTLLRPTFLGGCCVVFQ